MQEKQILDVCCGSRMFWFDKNNKNTVYMDIRKETFDIDECLRDSESDYDLLYDSFEAAENEALKEIDRIEKSCKENFENSLITGYGIEVVEKECQQDYLSIKEQEAYEQVITSINKYIYIERHRVKIIDALDNLVDIFKKGDL